MFNRVTLPRFSLSSALSRCVLLCCSTLLSPAFAETTSQPQALTIDRLYSAPSLSGKAPRSLAFSPDGTRVTYLQASADDRYRYDLWEYQIASGQQRLLVDSRDLFDGEETLSDEEKARRERQRVYGKGIMEYTWSKSGNALLFPLNGDLYTYDLHTKKSRKLTDTSTFETDARFSPQGNFVSFIREQNLFVINVKSGKEIQLTTDVNPLIKNGMSEFVAQEEMDRMTGYWWSDDEQHIAFLHVDETPVKAVTRNEIYADDIKLFQQRYPFTGTPNAQVSLALVNLKSKKKSWIAKADNLPDGYIPRVKWLPNSKMVSYQWQARNQQKLTLHFYDLQHKRSRTVLTETSKTWLNLHNDLYFLKDSSRFIWASERDGYKHLYLYRYDGGLVRQLTQGEWIVDSLQGVNESSHRFYFTATKDTPLEMQFYRGSFEDRNDVKRLTALGQNHHVKLASDHYTFIDNFSSLNQPNAVALRDINGKRITWLEQNALDKKHPLTPYLSRLVEPEYGKLNADDGQTLHYRLFKPSTLVAGKKYPVIVNVYGGPHAQLVSNRWRERNLYLQFLVQQGYVVFQLDNRGSYNRGKAFEDPIYRSMGSVEVDDQVAGVKWLRQQPFIDPQRIGIYGHSYGGYMSLMGLFKASEYFQAGVSGAPVTDWALYDTHYTERYMDHPDSNTKGYQASAVFPYIEGLQGDLLLYHGMADDNVLFTHSTKLMKQLQDKNKTFELMTYPGSKHSMRGKAVRVHLYNTITDFFNRRLRDKP